MAINKIPPLAITTTGVAAGSYGSASQVPVITVNAQGQITAATTTTVAGVSSVSYTASTGVLTINTLDGGVYSNDLGIGTGDSPTFSSISIANNITVGGTVDGRDVATDGTKLDGIEAGATADQTASEILTLLKTVDGSGSGLDADLLDGISSASFLRSDQSGTLNGQLTVNGIISSNTSAYTVNATSANFGYYGSGVFPVSYAQMPLNGAFQVWNPGTSAVLTVRDTGNVGIGTSSPSAKLNVSGDGIMLQPSSYGSSYVSGIKFRNEGYAHYTIGGKGYDFVISNTGTDGTKVWPTAGTNDLVTITSAGNVGIGTQTPAAKLDVNGAVKVIAGADYGLRIHSNSGVTASANYVNFFTSQLNGWAFNVNSTGADNVGTVATISTSGDITAALSYRIGDNSHWKIRPNNSNTDLAFEYSTLSSLSDANIKVVFKPNGYVGIGTNAPSVSLHVNTTDAVRLPVGNNNQRPSNQTGLLRYNNTDGVDALEFSTGSAWISIGLLDGSSQQAAAPSAAYLKTLGKQTGHYWINWGGTPQYIYCEMDLEGGGWMMVLNYVHLGGTNPNLNVRTADFPRYGSNTLGTDEQGSIYWGHISQALSNQFNWTEMMWYGKSSFHSRVIHFVTSSPTGKNYLRGIGVGPMHPELASTTYTRNGSLYNNASVPLGMLASDLAGFNGQGNYAPTEFPIYGDSGIGNPRAHWGIRGQGTRWEVDDYPGQQGAANNYAVNTIHRIWVR